MLIVTIACGNDDDDTANDDDDIAPPEGMVSIPAGTFMMGSPETELGRRENETLHEVTLTSGFWMSETEVTQAAFEELMGENPSAFGGCADCPVETVTWFAATAYANALSAAAGLMACYAQEEEIVTWVEGCDGYRLPTEAEWEYAARAGTQTAFYSGEITTTECGDPALDEVAHYCTAGTQPVAGLTPNAWGLYDMHGNVAEWVWDWYGGDYGAAAATDPRGPLTGEFRLDRGGSWLVRPPNCRAAYRDDDHAPDQKFAFLGFRLVRSVP